MAIICSNREFAIDDNNFISYSQDNEIGIIFVTYYVRMIEKF